MGLDMFAYTTRQTVPTVDFAHPDDAVEIAYWRKHPNLHGWMERLYVEKGGTADSFNCVPVRLEAQDLDALERAVKENRLPPTTGFFFGESRPGEMPDDLQFISAAREALCGGCSVFYTSWW